ncbi:MAG: hypothetical protein ABIQ09_06910 [Jatrophihabitantaceae bacterium]
MRVEVTLVDADRDVRVRLLERVDASLTDVIGLAETLGGHRARAAGGTRGRLLSDTTAAGDRERRQTAGSEEK